METALNAEDIESGTIRLSIPIDRNINDQFTGIIPSGLKSQVIRCLVDLVIKTQKDLGKNTYLIHHLIRGECKIIIDN